MADEPSALQRRAQELTAHLERLSTEILMTRGALGEVQRLLAEAPPAKVVGVPPISDNGRAKGKRVAN